ncbi:VapE domain-containing protein [Paracoccus sp. SJTW-4]|uniref:VapE domain-containing protein n=1 Tax=Paracoccus sp. SJTW-4 TaxID=3078428 RepID=UPI0039EA963D
MKDAPTCGQAGAQGDHNAERDSAILPDPASATEQKDLLSALRLLHPEGPWHVSAKHSGGFRGKVHRDADDAADWALAQNRDHNTYVSIAALRPGFRGDKARKQDVAAVSFLWVDLDPRAGEPIDSERARLRGLLTDRLPAGVPPPSAVIDSGRGFWGLWRLAEPVVMPDADAPGWDTARASVEDRNRGLELGFGADACHNIERVMRLPGTVNRKPGAGPARIVAATGAVYRLTDFPAVPDPKAAPADAPVAAPAVGVDLAALPVPDRLRALIVNGCDPDEPQRWPSRSEALFHAVCGMVRAGCDDEVILGVILDRDLGISGHVLAQKRPETYARRQVARARADADDTFDCDKEGRPLATSQRNIRVALRRLGVTLRHDEFSGRDTVEGLDGFGPALDDATVNRLWLLIDERFQFRPAREFFLTVVADAARLNAFHPVAEYLAALRWDGVPRIGRWLAEYGGAVDMPYTRAVGELVLVAAVRRVRRPGVKFDEMLVLESPQGTNKSTALKLLAVRDSWFTDDLPLNAETRRVIEALSGKWIVEAGELKGLKKGGADHLKGFLSRTHDKARMAYDRLEREVPRQCVIIGTTNDSRYLRDTTGNRRFWPVAVSGFDLDALRRDRDQLWAEAAAREAEGMPIRLDPALWDEAAAEQDARRVEDPYFERLHSVLGEAGDGKLRGEDAWRIVGKPSGQRTQDDNERLGDAMRRLGFERAKRRFGGPNPEWCYVRGDGAVRIVPEFGPDGELLGVYAEGDGWRDPF